MNIQLRCVSPSDASDLLSIYAPYVTDSAVSFELLLPSVEDFAERIVHYSQRFPWIVAENESGILGYAYAYAYRERKAYQWCVETSVYLAPDAKGKGIGKLLYDRLFEILIELNITRAYAVITLPNPASVQFHAKMGFLSFATYQKVGHKFNAWHDVHWMEKELQSPQLPSDPIAFADWLKTASV
jgi:phosphinothricin acetyltransferase